MRKPRIKREHGVWTVDWRLCMEENTKGLEGVRQVQNAIAWCIRTNLNEAHYRGLLHRS